MGSFDKYSTERLLDVLGYIPLAITQAAALLTAIDGPFKAIRVLLDLVEKQLNGTPRVAERILNDESAETVSDKKDLSSFGVYSLSLSYKVTDHILSIIN